MQVNRDDMKVIGDRLADMAANLSAATARFLADVRSFDDGCGWYCDGFAHCRDWLKWRLGLSAGTAREYVRVAKRLGELPLVDEALGKGEISYCKARAITRVANAQTEAYLVECAAYLTGSQLETLCAKLRSVDAKPVEAERRSMTQRPTDDGMVKVTITMRPEEAVQLWSVIESLAGRVSTEASVRRTFDRVDAMVEIVDAQSVAGRGERGVSADPRKRRCGAPSIGSTRWWRSSSRVVVSGAFPRKRRCGARSTVSTR